MIGNLRTPDLDTGFADRFEDYAHPNDFFQPWPSRSRGGARSTKPAG